MSHPHWGQSHVSRMAVYKGTINKIFQIYSGNWLKHSTGKKTWSYTIQKRSSTWIPTDWFHNFLSIISWQPYESRRKKQRETTILEARRPNHIWSTILEDKVWSSFKNINFSYKLPSANNINKAQNNIALEAYPGS